MAYLPTDIQILNNGKFIIETIQFYNITTTSSSNISILNRVLQAGETYTISMELNGVLTSTWAQAWSGTYIMGLYKGLAGNIQSNGISATTRENFTSNPNVLLTLTNPSTFDLNLNSQSSQTIRWCGKIQIIRQLN